jgi:DNA-binding NarL/FixJ family response regulator
VIRVLIISGIRLYRDGLAHVLALAETVSVVGAIDGVRQSLDLARDDIPEPDVVLLDTTDATALSNVRELARAFSTAKIVALGVARDDEDVIACAEAGIDGYVFRDASVSELVATIQSAARGELRCSPEMAATLLRRVADLARHGAGPDANVTRREREILELIDKGLTNKEIAARLFIEVATVKNHIHHILEKLGAKTRSEAAAKMRRMEYST